MTSRCKDLAQFETDAPRCSRDEDSARARRPGWAMLCSFTVLLPFHAHLSPPLLVLGLSRPHQRSPIVESMTQPVMPAMLVSTAFLYHHLEASDTAAERL